ncbi:MAG TPA: choice-of-anchor tandem repeat GloVer-containing protein [Candidatus Cybelea sp.]|jgi:uncharacterized repeat protein (TIGR03803 family)|nr:choice-of-anchor tandem repeat GloVer-containing protein [Candidatus Cybelea sp.]
MVPYSAGHGAGFAAAKEQVLYSFTGGSDGGDAATGLILDGSGNLYGTTVVGGAATCGTVFKLTPAASPPWPETVLFNFDCFAKGKTPYGGVTFDPHGNLDGSTVSGGSGGSCGSTGCGLVYQLTPTTENVLHSFTGGTDGFGPGGAVVFDTKGNLFGTTPDGGASSHGVVYEIPRNGQEKVIHAFTGGNDGGTGSLGALLYVSGNLYGVTETGGKHMWGTVYRLSPGGGGLWNLKTLYTFKGPPDAGGPYGGLIADASGKLYGTTYYGGANSLGTVFAISRGVKGKYREHVLYSFKSGNDGNSSTSTLVFGAPGVLYGTTSMGGGSCNCGTIFKVDATTGKEAVLHAFAGGADGAFSYYGLTKGANGKFYGTTVQGGGNANQGTVFEFTP